MIYNIFDCVFFAVDEILCNEFVEIVFEQCYLLRSNKKVVWFE